MIKAEEARRIANGNSVEIQQQLTCGQRRPFPAGCPIRDIRSRPDIPDHGAAGGIGILCDKFQLEGIEFKN